MIIEGMRKTTLLDYPGKVACTLFTYGCNFRCPFCHNASLVVRERGEGVDDAELSAFLEKRVGILDGVCITGGEPLLHGDIKDLIKKIRAYGYSVKLDTNGSRPDMLASLIAEGLVDHVAMDIKSSRENYSAAAGVDVNVADIEKSVNILMSGALPFEFRTTAVKGLHTVEDFARIGEWLKGAPQYFIQQFTDSGDLIGSGFAPFNKEESVALLEVVLPNIPNAKLRGM